MYIIPILDEDIDIIKKYKTHKALLKINNEFLIKICLDCFTFNENEEILFIFSMQDCANYKIDNIIQLIYPNLKIQIIRLTKTKDVVDTLEILMWILPSKIK